jgi:psp operon transcriptional activator
MTNHHDTDSGGAEASRVASVEALGQSEAFLSFTDRLSQVAPVNRPVLLIGERGTGKELAAARLHFLSRRWQAPLLTLNCAALTPSLIEAELFGHERGAFTGAERRRVGRFEAAADGTLFLDEIGNIPPQVQAKILRVVEYGSFERVGGTQSVEVDVRIIGATHADLPGMVRDGSFRADLLDRLAFEVLPVPALRERIGDIDLLADYFARRMAVELGYSTIPGFSRAARGQLQKHAWPGNVRELKNVVERAVFRSAGQTVEQIDLDPFAVHTQAGPPVQAAQSARVPDAPRQLMPGGRNSLPDAVADLEIGMLQQALKETRFNQKAAARRLNISYDRLRGLVRKYQTRLG